MKRETDHYFSVLFLLIGYSSTLHQRMKGNEKKIISGTERKCNFSFPSQNLSSHRLKNSDGTMMNG
ncbi:hypothetical protein IMSAGC022_01054 [Alistipes sp.]|nr:hypothetical protein IMSAGC022_01054 [Alistipes sp.]